MASLAIFYDLYKDRQYKCASLLAALLTAHIFRRTVCLLPGLQWSSLVHE